ncbi:hypothetical protein GYMLUDRAFT_46939 [Collybiopsis luxurians FD-317 M1]|uniref:AB hydrolase-1 domain-containing protein n=1 Tax=Collybiopsis luxurians FD-317 M1 TaxID=944289 RepID=A0A0D0CMY3_9AGAR|nr:hypothetical protein GYMLUDRAFT_46939 [Collybiopsis luxurians FD-317 M1]
MPFVQVSTSTGKTRFHYTISTPTCANAESITAGLPVLLFFHAMAFHAVFHSQFRDPLLRKFNLVTFHLRFHGDTTCDTVPEKYGAEDAAEDAVALIDALHLPPCHFVAMDIGSMIAMQIAVTKPEKVLSLFIMSHLCMEELPEVRRARTELYDLWFSDLPDAHMDVALGYSQYTFSSNISNLAQALTDYSAFVNLKNWDQDHKKEYRLATYNFFVQRGSYTREALSRIACPVKLVQGSNSLVYPESYTRNFVRNLKQAGVNVSWLRVPNAPHYLCVDYGPEVNWEIHDFVLHTMDKASIPTAPRNVSSPWDKILREWGWTPEKRNEFDDDDITISFPSPPGSPPGSPYTSSNYTSSIEDNGSVPSEPSEVDTEESMQ